MPRALVLTGHDITSWQARYERGDAPAALPYEVDALRGADIEVDVRSNSTNRWVAALRPKVEHRTGFAVSLPIQSAPSVPKSDLVLALLERDGALASILRRRGVPPYSRRPLVIYSWRLAYDLTLAAKDERRRLVDRYSGADLITHMSPRESEILVDAGFPEHKLFGVTFGASDRYYTPGSDSERDIDILAVGQDEGRDYGTLFAAIEGTSLQLDLVCKPENLSGLRVPPNVRLHGVVPHSAYRRLLRRAKVVAVPSDVRSYPTGSSVVLEAGSSGCCVVATGTPAMADYITDGTAGLLVPPGDVAGWRETLVELLHDDSRRRLLGREARRAVETTFNARRMWHELADVMRERGLVPVR